ncbi:helix-turn-helix domain-containing protein [Frankia sp. AiPa1]|uniref:helix-turn-helix transcriptional regulator n=1 Tax=Frankia sp. AiPa1 TaxID=573492 RepID=UPI00202B71A1|nr:helix-turn-helix transcriptional regulator [Frankia sp. AiPa1]MCL9760359.1 helix-turn-helix transcriptional regulator [Frankia sp. AiPa1]
MPAGTYPFDVGDQRVTGWHHHDLHQLEYCFEGVAQVETAAARYLLPPHQAVWIPAGVEHCTSLTRVRTMSVFFHPSFGIMAGDRPRVVPVAPILREMVLYAARWPIGDPDRTAGPTAAAFFTAIGSLVEESLQDELALVLPRSDHPLVSAAIDYTMANLADVTVEDLCRSIGTSTRTLRRLFRAETGLTWQRYLLRARILRAMAALAEPGPSVIATAMACGFGSVSGFVRAFRQITGTTPLAYRKACTLRGGDAGSGALPDTGAVQRPAGR